MDIIRKKYKTMIWLILLCLVLVLQTNRVGFERGHLGWVSSQHLSIITRSSMNNGFVGYTADIINNNKPIKYYFNRAPFVFEALCHYILRPIKNNLQLYISFCHQIMNIIFVLSIIFAFKVINVILKDEKKSISVSLISFTGYFSLYYKDLIEQNRLGVLAMLIVTYGILRYRENKNFKSLILYITLGAAMGEAAPALFVLVIWIILELTELYLIQRSFKKYLKNFITSGAIKGFLIGLTATIFFIGYNTLVEATVKNIPVTQTGVFKSAKKRLGQNEEFQKKHGKKLQFFNYYRTQFIRLTLNSYPYILKKAVNQYISLFIYLIFILLGIFLYIKRKIINFGHIYPVLLLLLPSILYMHIMKNLATFHDFTITYYVGISILIYTMAFSLIPSKWNNYLLIITLGIFTLNLFVLKVNLDQIGKYVNSDTYDFNNIIKSIDENKSTIYIENGYRNFIPGSPYAPCFYLSGHYITPNKNKSDYILTKVRNRRSMTPKNKRIFLYKNTDIYSKMHKPIVKESNFKFNSDSYSKFFH